MTATAVLEPVGVRDHEISGPAGAPVVLALGGISANHHVVRTADDPSPGWWEGIAGRGRAIDTATHRVLGVDFLDGGCAHDGRPASIVTTHDQAAHVVAVLDHLGVDRLDTVVGASYGGMVALALAERWPERVGRLVVISAAHEPTAMGVGLRSIQRRIVELGLDTGRAAEGMVLGRALAMTTYRSAREFSERFDVLPCRSDRSAEFDVERYLVGAGDKFAARTRPERFLALSLSVDLHRVTPESIGARTTVIAARGDAIAPPPQLRAMAKRLPNVRAVHTLETRFGHDAFLAEQRRLGALLSATLAD